MMTRIFIEAKKKETSEGVFINTLLSVLGKSDYDIVYVDGKDNLHNVRNKFIENTLEGGRNIIIFDADTKNTGGGFDEAKKRILSTFDEEVCIDDLFLYPNNCEDGIFENLLEKLMRCDKHSKFIDCFYDYELCLGEDYVAPDLKGKLHTYMSAQKSLSKKQRNALGSGQWLFENENFWDLNATALEPLKVFISKNVE